MPHKDPLVRKEYQRNYGREWRRRWVIANPEKHEQLLAKQRVKNKRPLLAPDEIRKRKLSRVRNYEAKYPEKKRQYNRNFYKSRKTLLHSLKDYPCTDCDVQYPPYVMHFDHVPERGEKAFDIGKSFYVYSVEKLMEEIAKCDLVCANCHAERTHQRKDDDRKRSAE